VAGALGIGVAVDGIVAVGPADGSSVAGRAAGLLHAARITTQARLPSACFICPSFGSIGRRTAGG